MATDYKKHLTTEILSDQHIVSYRILARAVKVHVNAAKCMLYEFYAEQSRRKPGSVYATYLLAGVKKDEKPQTNGMTNGISHDEDEEMPPASSPPPFTSSMLDPSQQNGDDHQEQHVLRKTITLVREENLEEVKAAYETISSIHIYSLSPGKMPDLTALTDLGRSLYANVFVKEDPLTHNKTYGVIQNPQVRRRKGKRPVIPSAPAPKFQPVKDEKVASKANVRPATSNLKKEDTASRPSSRDSTAAPPAAPPAKQPTLKRGGSSISDAFAKTKHKKASSQPKQEDDVKMTDEDDGEEDDAMFLDTGTKTTKKRTSEAKQERENKAAKLRKMMDSDDEAEVPKVEDAPDSEINKEPAMPAPEAKEDEDEVAWSASEDGKEQPAEDTGPKRRRGKRKVMKKKTAKDEDGFLVTREEEVWESFSESDHGDMRKPFVQKSAKLASQGSQKSAKGGTQGKTDIMSFFGRKK